MDEWEPAVQALKENEELRAELYIIKYIFLECTGRDANAATSRRAGLKFREWNQVNLALTNMGRPGARQATRLDNFHAASVTVDLSLNHASLVSAFVNGMLGRHRKTHAIQTKGIMAFVNQEGIRELSRRIPEK